MYMIQIKTNANRVLISINTILLITYVTKYIVREVKSIAKKNMIACALKKLLFNTTKPAMNVLKTTKNKMINVCNVGKDPISTNQFENVNAIKQKDTIQKEQMLKDAYIVSFPTTMKQSSMHAKNVQLARSSI